MNGGGAEAVQGGLQVVLARGVLSVAWTTAASATPVCPLDLASSQFLHRKPRAIDRTT